jgi:hypothetical protein
LGAALVGGLVWGLLPFRGYFSILIAAGIGYGVGELIGLAVNRRRGPGLQVIAGVSVFISFLASRLFPSLFAQMGLGLLVPPQVILLLVYRILLGALMDPIAWITIAIGVLVGVSRLR